MTPDTWVKSGYSVFWSRPGSAQHEYQLLTDRRQRPRRRLRAWLPLAAVLLVAVLGLSTLGLLHGQDAPPGFRAEDGDGPPQAADRPSERRGSETGDSPAVGEDSSMSPGSTEHSERDQSDAKSSDTDRSNSKTADKSHGDSGLPARSSESSGEDGSGSEPSAEHRNDPRPSAQLDGDAARSAAGQRDPKPLEKAQNEPSQAQASQEASERQAKPTSQEQRSPLSGKLAPREVLVVLKKQDSKPADADGMADRSPASVD
ncbi:nucleolar RNA helicase 2-like [Pollicipes pollicipes]|uniref:nucleolar RNA helicase 2-like n=1 Tax=Pollicipes pollicipes TaxID=41117 RepID=UPI001885472D|nr:nucleolar RNA helicase 2-like [Pollicipes pollicipes]